MNLISKIKYGKMGHIFRYSLIKYIALAFGFLRGIVNAKFLGPELLGILGNLTLVLGYLSYANLGILSSMNREYVLAKINSEEEAEEVLNTTFSSLFLLSILFLVLSILSFILYKSNYAIYLSIIFIIAIFDQFRSYFINYFRLINNYKMINLIEIINNIILFILTILLISKFKVFGILFSMLLCGIIILFLGIKKSKNIKFKIDFKILKSLINIGIPLLIYNLGFYILTTIDRWIIIKYFEKSDLGYYTFANSMVSATLVFITSMLFLLYPKVIKEFNEENSKDIIEKVKNYTKLLEIGSIIFFTVGIILYRPFIIIFLNKYNESIGIYMLLLIAIIINNLSYFANAYIVSNKKQIWLVYIQIIVVILNLSFNIIFVKVGLGTEGVALGTLLANSVYSFIQYLIFIKLNIKKIKFLYVFKVYIKIIIYSLFIIFMTFAKIKYSIYVILAIILTLMLYFNEIKNVKVYLQKVKD